MTKMGIALVLLIFISCQGPQEKKRSPANQYLETGTIDCNINDKGCLLKRESNTVILFFRGWVPAGEMHRYRGQRKKVDKADWVVSSRDMLTKGELPLAKVNLKSSIYVTGSSHLSLSMNEMDNILEEANAKYLILASHSGGYKGMRGTVLAAKLSYWDKVIGVWLLDNYYGGQAFANDLKRNFGEKFLRHSCYGFVTDHNILKFRASYESFCPQTRTHGVSHSGGVLKCMPYFELNELCKN